MLCVLDRDGTIVKENGSCLSAPADVVLEEGVPEGLKHLHDHGVVCVVATNQSCVSSGQCTFDQVNAVNAKILAKVSDLGGYIRGFYMCPHGPEARCGCRKPSTGLLAWIDRDYAPASMWFVGDSLCDLQAAREFGVFPILVRTGKGRATEAKLDFEVLVVDTLIEAAKLITNHV